MSDAKGDIRRVGDVMDELYASIQRLSWLSWPQRYRVVLPYMNAVGAVDKIFYCSARRVKKRHDRRVRSLFKDAK